MSREQWKTKELREADRMLKLNGYTRISSRGDHFKYSNGNRTIVITGKCNKMMMQRLIKEYGLTI